MNLTDIVLERAIEKRASRCLDKEAAWYNFGLTGATLDPRAYGTAQQNGQMMNQGISDLRNSGSTMWNQGLGKGLGQLWSGVKNTARGAYGAAYNATGRAIQDGVTELQKTRNAGVNRALKGTTAVLDGANRVLRAGHDMGLEMAKNVNATGNAVLRGTTAALDGATRVGQVARGMGRAGMQTARQAVNAAQPMINNGVNSLRRGWEGAKGFGRGLLNYYRNNGR